MHGRGARELQKDAARTLNKIETMNKGNNYQVRIRTCMQAIEEVYCVTLTFSFSFVELIVNFWFQADKKIIGALDFLLDICKKQNNKKLGKPWVVRVDVEDIMNDVAHERLNTENQAPVLFFYFDAAAEFQGAIVCADKHKILVESCASNAILAFVSIFHVCQVGYNDNVFNFLATLEHVLLGVPFKPAAYVPMKLLGFMSNWAENAEKGTEANSTAVAK